MGLMDVLGQYAQHPERPPPHVFEDFDRVAHEVPADEIGDGLEEAFKSDNTPPFEQMVGQLYDRSDDDTRAGLLNEILGSLGAGDRSPGDGTAGGLGSILAGGALGGMLRRMGPGNRISPEEARHVPVNEIESAAAEAARRNPSLIQRVSRFYARHPQIVQNLGQAALAIAMSRIARRRRF